MSVEEGFKSRAREVGPYLEYTWGIYFKFVPSGGMRGQWDLVDRPDAQGKRSIYNADLFNLREAIESFKRAK